MKIYSLTMISTLFLGRAEVFYDLHGYGLHAYRNMAVAFCVIGNVSILHNLPQAVLENGRIPQVI